MSLTQHSAILEILTDAASRLTLLTTTTPPGIIRDALEVAAVKCDVARKAATKALRLQAQAEED